MFDFGTNWQEFSRAHADIERLAIAAQSLQTLLDQASLDGLSFLDIGCGSGLFSLAACMLGARQVVGIDINPRSVEVSFHNRGRLMPNGAVEFLQMSVLDRHAMDALGQFDIVYAWGSLHHTGAMWQAIQNTAGCVAPNGTLLLALYNHHWTAPLWNRIKRSFSRLPRRAQEIAALPLGGVIYVAKFIWTRQNPLNKQRGMDFWYDVIDWLGGYPYEYATPPQIESFVGEMGLRLRKQIPAQVPTGCNEFVFAQPE